MRAGLLALFGVVFAAALAELLSPGKEDSGVKKAFRALTSLTVLLLISLPFADFLGNIPDKFPDFPVTEESAGTDYDEIFYRTVDRTVKAEFEERLSHYLEITWGVRAEDCRIYPEYGAEGELEKLSVRLSGAALLLDPAPVEEDLAGKFGCVVEVK